MAAGTSESNEHNHVVSLKGRSSGFVYAEIELVTFTVDPSLGQYGVGLTKNNPPSLYRDLAASANGILWRHYGQIAADGGGVSPSTIFGAAALAITNVIRIAINFTTNKVWIGKVGAAWEGGGDPATDTSPSFTIVPGVYYLAGCAGGTLVASDVAYRIRTAASQFTGEVPAGAIPWADGGDPAEIATALVLGLHGDGTAGAGNIVDSSAWGRTLLKTGTVTTEADVDAFGGSSLQFIDTATLSTDANSLEPLFSGTISGFFTFGAGAINSGADRPLFQLSAGTFGRRYTVRANQAGNDLAVATGTNNFIAYPCTWVAGQRHHVEIGWDTTGGNTYIFFDGVLLATVSYAPALATTALRIGGEYSFPLDASNPVTHKVDDFALWRVLKHSATFPVPTATDF